MLYARYSAKMPQLLFSKELTIQWCRKMWGKKYWSVMSSESLFKKKKITMETRDGSNWFPVSCSLSNWWWMDLGPSGSHHPSTQVLPLSGGHVLGKWLNTFIVAPSSPCWSQSIPTISGYCTDSAIQIEYVNCTANRAVDKEINFSS